MVDWALKLTTYPQAHITLKHSPSNAVSRSIRSWSLHWTHNGSFLWKSSDNSVSLALLWMNCTHTHSVFTRVWWGVWCLCLQMCVCVCACVCVRACVCVCVCLSLFRTLTNTQKRGYKRAAFIDNQPRRWFRKGWVGATVACCTWKRQSDPLLAAWAETHTHIIIN